MKAKVTLHFYAKSTKANTTGQFPIYIRLTVNGNRLEFSSKKFIDSSKWSADLAKMKGTTEEARSINSYLDLMKSKVLDIQMELIHKNEDLSIENFKIKIFGLEEKQKMLIPIFQDHNNKFEELVKIGDKAQGTLDRYETSLKHTIDYMQWKYNIKDIGIKKINHEFITEYEFYLRTVRKCNNNTAIKYIKNFKKIINICIANRWITENPFINIKSKLTEVYRDFILEDELLIIYNKKFATERLNLVKDIYVFSCFTGLAYIDVKQFNKSNICIGVDGNKWITKNRQKTDVNSKIPLLDIPLEILERYKDHPQCLNEDKLLPVLSNQKMNSYLKEIADLCGINKDLTYHTARHTFATTVTLSNGVPIESVSRMLGHRSIKTTQHYAKVLDKKVSDDMKILRGKFSSLEIKANIAKSS